MENVERASASDVRLSINEHSSRKCYLNLVAELSGTMGPRSSCCRKMQWLAMMISFFAAFLALWNFADHQTAKFEPKRTHAYSYQPNDWLQTSENSNAVQQDMSNTQESPSNRPESLVDEKAGVGLTPNASTSSPLPTSGSFTLLSPKHAVGKSLRMFLEWMPKDFGAWADARRNKSIKHGPAADMVSIHIQSNRSHSEANRTRDYSHFIKPLGVFRRAQDKNLHRRSLQQTGRKSERRRLKSSRSKVKHGHEAPGRLWFKIGVLIFAILSAVMYMMPGGMRGSAPRTSAHVGDAGPPFIGTATLKVPPAWSIERADHYSLRSWVSDLILWSSATDLEPHRLGPIAALQVNGSARDLVRELTPEQLAHGIQDPQTGQNITGLMVLVRTLIQRYAPLENEVSTRAVSEFLQFARIPGETTDSLLVRFDVLRNRAAQRGGLGLNATGLSWILFRAMNLPPELMDRLLGPNNGQLPQNEIQLVELMARIRRQGHLFEGRFRPTGHQGATGDTGAYYFPTFCNNNNDAESNMRGGLQQPWIPSDSAGSTAFHAADPTTPVYHARGAPTDGWSAWDQVQGSSEVRCSTCGVYFDDDDVSSATDTDDEEPDEGAQAYAHVEVDGQWRSDDEAVGERLYMDYLIAKRRWRRFSNRPPRRYRKFPNRPRAYGKGSRTPYSSSFASFLPANAFAGGKGKPKGKTGFAGKASGKGRGNPRGRDGRPLKCSKCGSTEHLWRRCPQVVQSQGGHSAADAHFATPNAQPALTLHTIQAHDAHETALDDGLDSGMASRLLPSVSFAAFTSARSEMSTQTGFEAELEALSQVSSFASRNKRKKDSQPESDSPSRQPPSWEPGMPSTVRPDDSVSQVGSALETLIPGARVPKCPPPTHVPSVASTSHLAQGVNASGSGAEARAKSSAERRQATLQLSSLLFPWWEMESFESMAQTACAGMYHLRTRIAGKVGLLVDPGAHDNLIGGNTSQLLAEQCATTASQGTLSKTLSVAGVGSGGQSTDVTHRVDLSVHDEITGDSVKCAFTAPVIEGSDLPPLLGLKSLRRMNAVVDCGQQLLVLPGPGGLKHEYPPGTVALKLELSPSGHLILPVAPNRGLSEAHVLDFMHHRTHADTQKSASRRVSSQDSRR
ncbi:unnamed protein product [Symbiodinium sp. CCMP2592]|nr:unnamed protein product [Symbiodinium sp. CCMP2592]